MDGGFGDFGGDGHFFDFGGHHTSHSHGGFWWGSWGVYDAENPWRNGSGNASIWPQSTAGKIALAAVAGIVVLAAAYSWQKRSEEHRKAPAALIRH